MNGLVAPKPAPTALSRWTRHAEFLVYLVPVGTISNELYDSYVRLLQSHSVIPIRSLTRPGGYAPELSPFRSFAWDGPGSIRLRFVSTTDKIETFDGEDVHASARAIGVLGICHCPTTPNLAAAYQQFVDSIRHFPGLLVQKCFAFEHQFDLRTVEECAGLNHLVMFPVYHELANGDGMDGGEVMSTVSLHLQVVLDTLCVTILMSLESTIRAAMRQVQAQANAPTTTVEMGDAAGFLLDTNIEPSNTQYQMNHANVLSPFPSREPIGSGGSSPLTRSLPATPTGERVSSGAAAPGGSGVGSLFVSAETRTRRRHLARQRKLFGDYALLLNCLPDAMEHYLSAIELLRDEERKSGGAGGDTLWLAAALEAYVFCLCQQSQDKFVVEIVEKASEAVALYSRAGVSELEISLIENIGWYYTAVTVQLSAKNGLDKVEEVVWVKRLLWELIERGAMVFSDLSPPRQVRFLIESAGMLEAVGHHRRMAFVLHEAVALLIQRWRAPVLSSPSIQSSQSHQRTQELKTAMRLETITAQRLGMVDRSKWEVTSLRWRARRLRRLQRQLRHNRPVKVTLAMAIQDVEPWLIMRFHILRQLVTMAKMLGDPALIGLYCIELLQVLTWCDEFASDTSCVESGKPVSAFRVDHAQVPFSSHFWRSNLSVGGRHGLHNRAVGIHGNNFNGVYGTPPASMEIKTKRYFTMANSPSSAVSSAAATITSTIANTPRTLMSTPRQQFSAAVNAMSNKATPAISSFSHNSAHISSPSPSTTHPSLRSSSGTGAELVNGVHMDIHNTTVFSGLLGSPTGVDGIKGHRDTSHGDFSLSNYDGNMAAWNLRSKVDIQRLQKSVLSILETECCVMRPTDQVKLNSFVYIHKMRVCYEAQSSPLLDTNAAMKKCGLAPSGSLEASSSCGFFYNPFESKPDHRPRNISCGSMVSDSESDDDEVELDKKTVELSFPVSELVQVEVLLSNPFGMDLDIQQISMLITHNADEVSRVVPSPSSANAEAYPSSVVLKPYEKRRVFLSVRCLRPGIFHISGCFVKVFNIKTSFRLKAPLSLVVVEPLPYLDISLVEIGHISEQSNSGEPLEGLSEMTGPTKTSTSVDTSVGDSTCMFTNEIKRCVLVVRNVGQRLVRTLHVTVRLGKAGMSLVLPSAKTVLSTSHHPDTDTEALVCETEAMVLKCLLSYQSIASLVPLKPGDQLAIPFEVSLRSPCTQSDTGYLHTLREQLHWSFLYGEQDIVTTTDASGRDCFRESQYVVTLIPLASLFVHRVDILPQSSTMSSRNTFDDKPFCTISVEISNPTETVFLLRVSSAVVHSMDTAEITPSSDVVEWDMEIGRQSSKTVVIEIPRVDAERFVQRSIADVLNECVVLTWRTYFNTSGRLLFWDGLWSAKEQELVRLQLCRSDVAFLIAPSNTEAMGQGNQVVAPGNVEDSLLGFPFRFFHPAVLAKPPHTISVKLFEPCPLTVQVMARACGDDDSIVQLGWSRVEAEVVVKSDRESDDGLLEETGDFLISGPSKRILTTDTAKAGELDNFWVWEWNFQLLFLTEGIFFASICGILVDGGEESQMPNVVTGHSTVRISCSSNRSEQANEVWLEAHRSEFYRVQKAMSAEYFLVPRLVWEDICLHIQASEIEELRWVIGNYLIDDNVQLKQELVLLLEMLSEYQRQSDEVRESLLSRSKSRAPEPPGRALLVEKLKILATDIVHSANGVANTSSREEELIKYVLSVGENANCGVWSSAVTTPRIAEAAVVSPSQSAREVVLLRPCTGYGCRPSTASSLCRPESRGSTSSICSTVSSIIESPEIRKCLNFVDIDSIREEVQGALLEEKQQLLEDIEFIQSCIDMEKELLDDDRRRVISVKPPPALQELQDLSRTLERTLHQQDSFEQVQAIVRKADPLTNGHRSLQKLLTAPTLPTSPLRPLSPEFFDNQYLSSRRLSKDGERISCSQDATTRKRVTRRVQSIRYTIQEARDEPFLT